MKKNLSLLLTFILIFGLLAGCGTTVTESPAAESPAAESPAEATPPAPPQTISLATLKGPTTMGLVKLLDDSNADSLDYKVNNTVYGTAEEVTALLVSGEVNMAAIPANVASILYNKTGGNLQVAAINTLGVLNVLELGDSVHSITDLVGKTIYSTGKGTTPEFALNAILQANGIDPETDLTIEYKTEPTEIAALLAGDNAAEGTVAVLPQPYATTVVAQNPDVRVALDLTQEWANAGIEGSLITGVLVVNREFAENNKDLVDSFLADYARSVEWVNANAADAGQLIADIGIVGSAAIAEKALPYCNIVFIDGADMKTALSAYLDVLFTQQSTSVGGLLPDDDFYYNAE